MEVFNNLCQAIQRILGSCFRSGIGRFASADTIVPNPANPQAYNRYSYVENNPLAFKDPSGHCLVTADGTPDSSDSDCWAQYWELDTWLIEQGLDPAYYLGNMRDWVYIYQINLLDESGTMLELLDFLIIRQLHYEELGYYCDSVGCIEDDIFGTGESFTFFTFGDSPGVCGAAALVTGAGGGVACQGLGYIDSMVNCFENGIDACAADFLADEVGGRVFSTATQPFQEGVARTLGRRISEFSNDLIGSKTNNDGVNDLLAVNMLPDTVYAPGGCSFLSCETRIIEHFNEKKQ